MTNSQPTSDEREGRVWLVGQVAFRHPRNGGTEYVRADLASATQQPAEDAERTARALLEAHYREDADKHEPDILLFTRIVTALETERQHAATAMRDKCIEAVNEFDGWVLCRCSECKLDGRAHAVDVHASLANLAAELQSLTLDQEKQKS